MALCGGTLCTCLESPLLKNLSDQQVQKITLQNAKLCDLKSVFPMVVCLYCYKRGNHLCYRLGIWNYFFGL